METSVVGYVVVRQIKWNFNQHIICDQLGVAKNNGSTV